MPPETPLAFGLHPNAEIGFKLREAEAFCNSLVLLQPLEGGGEGGLGPEEKAKMVLDDLGERLPEQFDLEAIRGRADEFTPYVMVAIQVGGGGPRGGGGAGVNYACSRAALRHCWLQAVNEGGR